MAPRVSVVIPVFNRPDTLAAAIDSVLAQTMSDLELVLVDDGSEPPLSAEALTDPRMRLVRHPKNRGAAAARNTGVDEARGEWIAFLDSDDAWRPEKLQRQLAFAESHDAGRLTAFATGWQYVSNGHAGPIFLPVNADDLATFAGGCWFCPGSTLLVRKSTIELIGPQNERLARLEDYEWFLRFAISGGHLRVLPEPLALVGRTGAPNPAKVREAANIITESYLRAGRQILLSECEVRRSLRAYLRLNEASALIRSGLFLSGLAALVKSFAVFPRVSLQVRRYWRVVTWLQSETEDRSHPTISRSG